MATRSYSINIQKDKLANIDKEINDIKLKIKSLEENLGTQFKFNNIKLNINIIINDNIRVLKNKGVELCREFNYLQNSLDLKTGKTVGYLLEKQK